MRAQITNYIRAGYPGLYLLSHEEQRVEAEIKAVAESLDYRLYAWSATTGLLDTATGRAIDAQDPMECITALAGLPPNTLILLRDFHAFLEDGNPMLVRALKDALLAAKAEGRVLIQRREAFGERARRYRLPTPRGVLLLGVPGTGKSLCAKAAASVFERPLIRLDMGALMGSLVGESEANLRSAIHVAEAIAPCIVWVDELDKGLAGSQSSGSTDGGTTARVSGSFISWMQERTAPVFISSSACARFTRLAPVGFYADWRKRRPMRTTFLYPSEPHPKTWGPPRIRQLTDSCFASFGRIPIIAKSRQKNVPTAIIETNYCNRMTCEP